MGGGEEGREQIKLWRLLCLSALDMDYGWIEGWDDSLIVAFNRSDGSIQLQESVRERGERGKGETAFAKGTKSAIIKEERIRERLEWRR
jgi:hypothetical protein